MRNSRSQRCRPWSTGTYGLAPRQTLTQNMYEELAARKQRALADLERAKTILAGARRAQEAFEEDARRLSVPPGWLRE